MQEKRGKKKNQTDSNKILTWYSWFGFIHAAVHIAHFVGVENINRLTGWDHMVWLIGGTAIWHVRWHRCGSHFEIYRTVICDLFIDIIDISSDLQFGIPIDHDKVLSSRWRFHRAATHCVFHGDRPGSQRPSNGVTWLYLRIKWIKVNTYKRNNFIVNR